MKKSAIYSNAQIEKIVILIAIILEFLSLATLGVARLSQMIRCQLIAGVGLTVSWGVTVSFCPRCGRLMELQCL
jgi:hypothetical protein